MIFGMLRIVVGSVVVLGLFAALVFPPLEVDGPDQWMARLTLMLLWMMGIGYVIDVIHLYSGAGLLVLLAVTGAILHRQQSRRYQLSRGQQMSVGIYETLSGFDWVKHQWTRSREQWGSTLPALFTWTRSPLAYVFLLAILTIMAGTAWLRFADDWHQAALFFSDASETLAWVKGIQVNTLFPNGLYPQGYYIVMAELASLTHANAIVFIKFFGAFVGTLMTASVMWSTYRFSGRAVPAIVAGALYGLMPHLMPYYGVRQMMAEGQEFGNMLVLPTAWLVFQSWVTRKPGYVLAASSLLAVVGLTHPIALLNAALAAVAATLGAWIVTGTAKKILRRYLWMVPMAALISILPLGIPYMMGVPLIGTATPFLLSQTQGGGLPPIPLMVWVALAGIGALFITKLLWYDDLWEMGLPATAFLLLLFSEGIVQLPRVGIDSYVLAIRSGEFLAMAEVLGIGLGVAAIQEALEKLGVRRSLAALSLFVISAAALTRVIILNPPHPFSSYSMQTDAYTREYVHIEMTLPNFSWIVVSLGSYAYAVNQGYQYSPTLWSAHVSPSSRWPHYHVAGTPAYALDQRYIFFFVPNTVHVPDVPGKAAIQATDNREVALLHHWIRDWEKRYGPMPVYYHSPNLTVYRLENLKNPI